ncbi:MAG: RNA polymerase factor sigma-32 [Methylocystis sp.]|nr:RNA polymerase factor sigma-32 [Methylocystis sp.]MCA3584958.1 RNA polymerase factor sigma-32 [Methylocystis sp.]MCA3589840.1 RNA polymerase factor sigma-32 [Methylocystis sp.]MCA3593497.1 RNA polymerase factor sigma-32 [Methylocystis sp.]
MAQLVGVRRGFVKAAMNAPFLTREDERALAEAWVHKGDERALHQLAHAHMRLVIAIAARFRSYGLPLPDLIQEGHVGLLEAAARFEPERDVRFSTYATWWIRASIQDHILRNWSIVRGGTSSAQKALFFNLRRLRARITQAAGSSASLDSVYSEIAATVGVSKSDVATMAARLSGPDTSLNAPLADQDGGTGADRMDFLIDDKPRPDQVAEESIDSDRRVRWLWQALSVLSDRERRIIRERRLQDEAATLESLGENLGISKERVRQIENRALEKLKQALLDRHPDAALAMV